MTERRVGQPLSKEEEARRLAAYHSAPDDHRAAQACGVSAKTIRDWRYLRRLPAKRPRNLSSIEEARRTAAHALGLCDGETAELLKITPKAYALWRWNRKLPPAGPSASAGGPRLCRLCEEPLARWNRSGYCNKHFCLSQQAKRNCLNYRSLHPEKVRDWRKKVYDKVKRLWGSGLGCRTDGIPFEKIALQFLKSTNQYDSLLWASEYNAHFPFDIIAKRDGQLTFFEVTTATHHGDKRKPGRLWLANVLNGKLVAFFISPDGKRYVIKPVAKEHPSIHLTLEDARSAKEFEA